MVDYQTLKIKLPLNCSVIKPRGFTLSDHQKLEIESIWRNECTDRASDLFDGQIFNLVEIQGDQVIGEFVPYKYYLAQLRNKALKELLLIRPICISGVTLSGNKILIGKRSNNVTQYENFYETVPSGGIDHASLVDDKIDLQRQIEKELWEETGISITEVKKIDQFAFLYDPVEDIYEVCAEIQVNYTIMQEVLTSNSEYVEFQWLTKQELKKHLASNHDAYLPLSAYLLKLRRFL